jgi:hypothetical protein
MRAAAICSFVFLTFALLVQGQGDEIPTCRPFLSTTGEKYEVTNVRSFLDLAMRGARLSFADQGVQNLGDGATVAFLKIVPPSDLGKPEFIKVYLDLARTAFSVPDLTMCKEDKSPEVTLFLLAYFREKTKDAALQHEIDSTKEFIAKQTSSAGASSGPPK